MLRQHWHIVVLTYACDTCGAPPGQPCRSHSGRAKQTEVHVARSDLARAHGWVAADLLDQPDQQNGGGRDAGQ